MICRFSQDGSTVNAPKILRRTRAENYHPHGEAVILPHAAFTWRNPGRCASGWSMGRGQFGIVEGDPPACHALHRARMTHLGAALMDRHGPRTRLILSLITTRPAPNRQFFSSCRFRICSLMAETGIAARHGHQHSSANLGEVIDGICAQIDDPDITSTS